MSLNHSSLVAKKRNHQAGSVILEAMIAILIFSMGILAIVGMQVGAMRTVSDAQYRMEASFLASRVISEINVNFSNISTFTQLPIYTTWQNAVRARLPVSAVTPAPTVTLVGVGNNWVATVVVNWQAPGDPDPHRYTAVTNINR